MIDEFRAAFREAQLVRAEAAAEKRLRKHEEARAREKEENLRAKADAVVLNHSLVEEMRKCIANGSYIHVEKGPAEDHFTPAMKYRHKVIHCAKELLKKEGFTCYVHSFVDSHSRYEEAGPLLDSEIKLEIRWDV